MILMISGSRDISDVAGVCRILNGYHAKRPISRLIQGTADGVDQIARRWARENEIPFVDRPADWKTYGKVAGHIRNAEMSKESDHLLAIWNGVSKGTKNAIECWERAPEVIHGSLIIKDFVVDKWRVYYTEKNKTGES